MNLPKIEISSDTAKKLGFRDENYAIRRKLLEFQRLVILQDGKALSLSATLRYALKIANEQYRENIKNNKV